MDQQRNAELLGELKEFKKYMTSEMKELRRDVKSLLRFKWRAAGALALLILVLELLHPFEKLKNSPKFAGLEIEAIGPSD